MLKKLLKDRSGNFGVLAAIVVVPLLGTAGMVIDFSRAMQVKAEMQNAADAAVVGAISEKSAGVTQAIAMTTDGTLSLGEAEGMSLFKAQTDAVAPDSSMQIKSIDVKVTKVGKNLSAVLVYNATVNTTFMRLFGKQKMDVSGTAKAVYQTQSFMDFYMLLDNTPSMGVAATPADVTNMIAATKNAEPNSSNCAFACHIVSEAGVEDMNSNYNIARNNGITIRIDVVAKAVAALTTEATRTQSYSNQFRMAAYTFGETAMDVKLQKVAALTADMSKVKSATGNIKLMSIPKQGYNNDQQTSFDDAMTKIGAEIDAPGDGTSSGKPEKTVFFVADGVGDSLKPKCTKKLTGSRCQEPIDITYCQKLKDRNIKVAVLYTTYLPLPNNDWYNTWIKPFQSEIGTRMQACASPGFYFEVSPTQGIEEAMKALFNKVVRSPRLAS